jgi:hypothetical protein
MRQHGPANFLGCWMLFFKILVKAPDRVLSCPQAAGRERETASSTARDMPHLLLRFIGVLLFGVARESS